MPPPTLIAHKSTFLATQTLHLSQALTPSAAWRAANDRAEDGLPTRAVDDAVYRLNHALTQHARRVYAPQATRHVAEQIQGLFHDATERALRGNEDEDEDEDGDGDGDGGGLPGGETRQPRLGADFATDDVIASLPPTWDVQKPREAADHPLEARRYAELTAALTSLSKRRREARERVERLRRMAALLAPFESNGDGDDDGDVAPRARTSVQENLVTRNGEVERELERMRLLLARVAGRVARLPDGKADDEDAGQDPTDLDSVQRDKVEKLLDRL